jgi:iron-sulfur cluster repair protein YtfE (RIC family)
MRRHPCLIALSHDHHHGLLLAQLLKKDAPPYKTLPQTTEGKIEYALNAWTHELEKHFSNEEEILFPFIKGRDDILDELIVKIISEHRTLENLFVNIENADNKIEHLDKIGLALESHIRLEERELFRKIQEVFSSDELDVLEGKIEPVKPKE